MVSFSGLVSSGSIEVICGPMFSGKTEELIRRVRRSQIARQKVQIFKPGIDDRFSKEDIVSHSSQSVKAVPIKNSIDILKNLYNATRVVAIDEVQFFDETIIKVIEKLAGRGCRVICAGLDQDSYGKPFGPIPTLLAIADHIDKVHAICTVCGNPASKSQRIKSDKSEQVLVGEADFYEARCRTHFDVPTEEEADILAYTVRVKDANSLHI